MDKGTVAVEESRSRHDPGASASKSMGAIVQIDSISIDINCAYQEIEPPEGHDNFSIREFVAGMWEKNWKMCMPFEDIVDGKNALEMQLICGNDAGASSHPNADKGKDGSLSCDIIQTGMENGLRDSRDKEDSDPCNKLVVYSPRGTEIYRPACNGEQAYSGDDEGRSVAEVIPLQIQESHPNAAVGNPSVKVKEPKHDSSGSDHTIGALYKRQKKLRSLVDILELDKISISEKSRMGSASSSGMQEKSTDAETDLQPPPVELDIAKGMKNPRRKKKAVPEQGSEHEPANVVGVSKRLKSSTPRVEKTSTRVQIGDSESERGASMLLGLRDNGKTLQIKPKKNKPLDTSKKVKKTHIHNRAVPTIEFPKMNDVPSSILLKHVSAADASFGHTGNVPSSSTLGREVEPCFPSSSSAWQMDRMSKPSVGKTTVSESRYSPLMHRNKSSFEDQNTHRRVALDLSLNSYMGVGKTSSNQVCTEQEHMEIPDLNELFVEKTPTPHEDQFPTVSEKSVALQRHLERTPSCSKDPIRKETRNLGVGQQQAVQNTVAEPGGASDDIPMDIVELLAMHQHKKTLGDLKQQCVSRGINSSTSGSSAFTPHPHGSINFPFPNASSSSNPARHNVPVNQGVPNFLQGKRCQYDVGNLEGNQFRFFNSYLPSQQKKAQCPVPKSLPRPNEGSDLVWPPRQRNVPFHPSITPNHSVPPNAFTLQSFPDQSYNGKTISNLKGNGKTSIWDASMVNEGRIGLSSKSVPPVKDYSNEAIPAMQLLSLMDQGVASSSSFKMGTSNFLDKHSSPYSQHMNLKGNENPNNPFLNASLFQPNSHKAGISRVIDNVYCGESLRKTTSQDQSHPEQGSSKNIHSKGPSTTAARQLNDDLELGACVLNRNPADFTILDKGNEFTINHKDLKPKRKRNAPKETTRPGNANGQKKQRARKISRK